MENIELINYRCFKHLTLSFKSKVNLLIGDNASGKTTIIRALRVVLNSFFLRFSDENTRFFGLSKDDFTVSQTAIQLTEELPITIKFRYKDIDAALELRSKKGSTLQKPLQPMANYATKLYKHLFDSDKRQVHDLPLFACFMARNIHYSRKISEELFKKYLHKPSFGYYECLQGEGFLPFWTKRLLVLKEGHKGELELLCVRQAVIDALGTDGCNIIFEMDIRYNQGKIYYFYTDNLEVATENLSDGYRRLVNIVVDLAFRCALLNGGIFGTDACKRTTGTVLIDEIELHLHPALQSLVLKGLQNAFPKLQFIVTTHAPMVMTGIPINDDNVIYKLSYSETGGYKATTQELYGLDASTITELALHTIPRSAEVETHLDKLFEHIDSEQYTEASQILNEMQQQFGDKLPELAKAEAMLNFLYVGDDNNK